MCKYPSKEYFIKEYIQNGKAREELARENHVSVSTIKTHLYEKRIVKPPSISYDILYDLYVTQRKTMKEIALITNHDRNAVSRAIRKYGIKRENHYVQYDDSFDDEWVDLYVNEGLSTFAIAKLYGCTHGAIKRHLLKNGVKMRNISEAERRSRNKDPLTEDVFNYDVMYELYVGKKMTLNQLAAIYNCTAHTVRERLVALNIPIRSQSEVKIGLMTGSSHPNWQGGVSSLTPRLREFYATNLAPLARKRDGYTCRICGSHSNLHCHHVIPFSWIIAKKLQEHNDLDPEKDVDALYNIIVNDPEFLDISNLVTYCKECHLFRVHGYKKTISNQDSKKE